MRSQLDDFTEGRAQDSKDDTEGRAQDSKAFETWPIRHRILIHITENLEDHGEKPSEYLLLKDLAKKLGKSTSTISYHIQELEDSGLIEVHKEKTNLYQSYTVGYGKVYTPTREGYEYLKENYGGLCPKFERFTAGASKFELFDLHGDLVYRFDVKETPDQDIFDWDRVIPLSNGVEQKIKKIGNQHHERAQRATIEYFKGSDGGTITMKPRVTDGRTPEDLMKACDEMAWMIRKKLTQVGYELSFPEKKGSGKFTLVREDLKNSDMDLDVPLLEDDRSRGEREFHPQGASLEENAEIAKALTERSYMAKASRRIEQTAEKIESVEELKEKLNKQGQTIAQQNQAIGQLADQVQSMSKSINKLGNALNQALDGAEQPDMDQTANPPGGMYG